MKFLAVVTPPSIYHDINYFLFSHLFIYSLGKAFCFSTIDLLFVFLFSYHLSIWYPWVWSRVGLGSCSCYINIFISLTLPNAVRSGYLSSNLMREGIRHQLTTLLRSTWYVSVGSPIVLPWEDLLVLDMDYRQDSIFLTGCSSRVCIAVWNRN